MFGDEQSNRRGETMLKTLGAQVKEYKKASIVTPVFMILEVIMEMIIPLMMASIIDDGVEAGNLHHRCDGRLDDRSRTDRSFRRCDGRKIRRESINWLCEKLAAGHV